MFRSIYATDRRQTVRQKHRLMPPPDGGGGILIVDCGKYGVCAGQVWSANPACSENISVIKQSLFSVEPRPVISFSADMQSAHSPPLTAIHYTVTLFRCRRTIISCVIYRTISERRPSIGVQCTERGQEWRGVQVIAWLRCLITRHTGAITDRPTDRPTPCVLSNRSR